MRVVHGLVFDDQTILDYRWTCDPIYEIYCIWHPSYRELPCRPTHFLTRQFLLAFPLSGHGREHKDLHLTMYLPTGMWRDSIGRWCCTRIWVSHFSAGIANVHFPINRMGSTEDDPLYEYPDAYWMDSEAFYMDTEVGPVTRTYSMDSSKVFHRYMLFGKLDLQTEVMLLWMSQIVEL